LKQLIWVTVPQTAGNQHDFVAVQSFSFPSVYIRKNQLAKEQIKRSENEINSLRQDILLNAKLVCVQLIFHSKINKRLLMLQKQNEIILNNFEKRLQSGDGNILDVNKSRFQLIAINNQLQHNNSASTQLQQKLIELNGGVAVEFRDTIYPADTLLPPFEILENDYEKNDPLRKMLEQDVTISRKKIEVARSMSFPKMELGYHYQGILGQDFSGIHTGITIPLWENKNAVKQKKSEILFSELSLNAHLNEHYFHIKHTYEKYLNLKGILNNYRNALLEINSPLLLEKSLALGHISTIEYFMEMQYFNDAYNSYLDTEKEFHEVIAELLKYKL